MFYLFFRQIKRSSEKPSNTWILSGALITTNLGHGMLIYLAAINVAYQFFLVLISTHKSIWN